MGGSYYGGGGSYIVGGLVFVFSSRFAKLVQGLLVALLVLTFHNEIGGWVELLGQLLGCLMMELLLQFCLMFFTTAWRDCRRLLVQGRLCHHCIFASQVLEVVAVQRLLGRNPLIRIVDKQFNDQLLALHRHVRDELGDPCACRVREVEVNVGGTFLESVKDFAGRSPEDVVDLVDLVFLIIAREEWEETQDFKEYTANSPYIHLVVIVSVR